MIIAVIEETFYDCIFSLGSMYQIFSCFLGTLFYRTLHHHCENRKEFGIMENSCELKYLKLYFYFEIFFSLSLTSFKQHLYLQTLPIIKAWTELRVVEIFSQRHTLTYAICFVNLVNVSLRVTIYTAADFTTWKRTEERNVEKNDLRSGVYAVTHLLRCGETRSHDFAIRHYFLTNSSWMRTPLIATVHEGETPMCAYAYVCVLVRVYGCARGHLLFHVYVW